MREWSVANDDCNMALVLSDKEGRRAFFAYSDLAKYGPPPAYTRYSLQPFAGLIWAIESGLKPYKTEGEIKGISAPSKQIEYAA